MSGEDLRNGPVVIVDTETVVSVPFEEEDDHELLPPVEGEVPAVEEEVVDDGSDLSNCHIS